MTDIEREEFIYDLANHYLSETTHAGLLALAIDRVSEILTKKTDEELIDMAPDNLIKVPQMTKDKRTKNKPTGF